MFGRRKQLRTLAAYMLLVWVLALATGVVNACVVELSAAVSGVSPMRGHHHDPDGTPPDQHQPPSSEKVACIKFCGDEASGVPTAKLPFDAGSFPGLALLPTLSMPTSADEAWLLVVRADSGPPLERVPIPIAFCRLTL